ncbi:hypothetical protein [Bombilactobacillus bombi]|uniref:hypothetical protein n=1 Tax=Bombilactobacillus bombi TaxID=1303590 RepID=UPI0035E94A77
MKLTIRNIDPDLVAIINTNLYEMKKKGIKINQSEYVIQLIEKALTSNFDEYKKDIFDQTINTLIDKFEEYIESNNELLKLFSGIEEVGEEDNYDRK